MPEKSFLTMFFGISHFGYYNGFRFRMHRHTRAVVYCCVPVAGPVVGLEAGLGQVFTGFYWTGLRSTPVRSQTVLEGFLPVFIIQDPL